MKKILRLQLVVVKLQARGLWHTVAKTTQITKILRKKKFILPVLKHDLFLTSKEVLGKSDNSPYDCTNVSGMELCTPSTKERILQLRKNFCI